MYVCNELKYNQLVSLFVIFYIYIYVYYIKYYFLRSVFFFFLLYVLGLLKYFYVDVCICSVYVLNIDWQVMVDLMEWLDLCDFWDYVM